MVVGLVFSQDNHLLITRRPSYMRSFPGAWVFPGGSVDQEDENLEHAISREVLEETGIPTTDWEVLCMWESVFPTIPEPDVPIKRHHLVVYLSTHLGATPSINLCEEEVDGALWLSPKQIEYIIETTYSDESVTSPDADVLMGPTGVVTKREKLQHLAGIYPRFEDQGSSIAPFGMAQGSLFALEQYWRAVQNGDFDK